MAHLLLSQISVSDLRKAQARSFGHAKRRARITAGIDENRPPPAVKRSVGFNNRMKAAGNAGRAPVGSGTDGRDGGHPATGGDSSVGITNKNKKIVDMGNVLPEAGGDQHQEAEVEAEAIEFVVSERDDSRNCLPPGNTSRHDGDRVMAPSSHFPSSSCQACGRVVLGHPLDTISARCGGIAARDAQGGQPIGAAAALLPVAGTERVIAVREGKVIGAAAAAAADAEHAWKQAAFANLPKSAGGTGSGELATAGCPRGRRNSGVGASAISRVNQPSCNLAMMKARRVGLQSSQLRIMFPQGPSRTDSLLHIGVAIRYSHNVRRGRIPSFQMSNTST